MLRRFSDSMPQHSGTNTVIGGPRVLRDAASDDMMTVVERRAEGVAGARASSCLIFSTDRGFTRIWEYPSNWMDLSDAELVKLSAQPRRTQQTRSA